tara:strand:- start:219 stop:638 length:420 start_codon:yes stop_codon:yes gene_type:complete
MKYKIILGYLGLIPFIFFTFQPFFFDILTIDESYIFLVGYGAIIISFLGGMSWGWQTRDDDNGKYIIGVIFSLFGFFLLSLSILNLTLSVLISALAFPSYFLIEVKYNRQLDEKKYFNLRAILTLITSACFIISFISFI